MAHFSHGDAARASAGRASLAASCPAGDNANAGSPTNPCPTQLEGVRVLRITGPLSQDGVDEIRGAFADQLCRDGPNVVDVSGVTHINTPGLAMLLSAHRALQASGGSLLLAGACGMVDEVIRCCHLDRVFTLAPDATKAVAQVRGA